ncbi:MAG: formylglycine-generating enzyme family protein [Fuerstiella sp.]
MTADEVDNFVVALGKSVSEAVTALETAAGTAEREQNWDHKARLALLALSLKAPALAQEMCQFRPDPIQRTLFIEECATWHGDLSKLVQFVADSVDVSLRSGMVLAVGSVPAADVSAPEKQAWEPVLANWYATASDTTTHSAAGWALRKWKLKLPEIAPSEAPSAASNWHVNTLDMTMLKIPAGSFVRRDMVPNAIGQTVTLTRSFLLADSEVTRAQFQQFMDDPEYPDTEKPTDWEGSYELYSPTEQHPVQQVSWYDAVLFCNWLSGKEDLMPCYERAGEKGTAISASASDAWRLIPEANGYRLPTEAEWEYACRAGTTTKYSFGDSESELGEYAWYSANSENTTHSVGQKKPNRFGLYDMHGNVSEWCHDWYGPYGSAATVSDPLGPSQGSKRLLRGGTFIHATLYVHSANRNIGYQPSVRDSFNGFRPSRTYP